MPMNSTVTFIKISASNNSKYAANKSLRRRYILFYYLKKASGGGAQGLTPQKSVGTERTGFNPSKKYTM